VFPTCAKVSIVKFGKIRIGRLAFFYGEITSVPEGAAFWQIGKVWNFSPYRLESGIGVDIQCGYRIQQSYRVGVLRILVDLV